MGRATGRLRRTRRLRRRNEMLHVRHRRNWTAKIEHDTNCDLEACVHSRASVVLWLTISPPRRDTPGSIPTSTKNIHDIYGAIWGKILCSTAICIRDSRTYRVAGLRAGPVGRICYNACVLFVIFISILFFSWSVDLFMFNHSFNTV